MYEPACMGHGQTHTPKALTTRVRVGTKTVHLMREPLLEADSGGSENYSLQVVSRRAQHAPAGKGGGWECSETGLPSLVLHQATARRPVPSQHCCGKQRIRLLLKCGWRGEQDGGCRS